MKKQMTETNEQVEKLADKLCSYFGYGTTLVPNDILPDIKESVSKIKLDLLERVYKKMQGLAHSPKTCDCVSAASGICDYNLDLLDALFIVQDELAKLQSD